MVARKNSGELSPGIKKTPHSCHHEASSASQDSHLDFRSRRFFYRHYHLAERFVQPVNLVLDFGCSPGFFTREFAKRSGDAGRVFAVEIQPEMLRILRERPF